MCEWNLLRKHRKRGCWRDGKLQSRECCSFRRKEETGNLPLRSKRPRPTGAAQPHLATSGGLRRESGCSRAHTHISNASHPSLSAGWEDAKLRIFHLTILLAEEKSGRGCCGCSRRRRRPGRLCAGGEERRGIRPPPPHDPLHYFTVANEEDAYRGAQMEEERRGFVWMLTARWPELYRIVPKLSVLWLCLCVPLSWRIRFVLIGIIQQQTKCRLMDSKVLLEKLFSVFFFFFSSQFW